MKQTALITGASSGIGYELALLFAQNNYNLVIVARDKDRLKKLKSQVETKYQIKAHIIIADLTNEKQVASIFDTTEKRNINIDILVNNAGFGDCSSFLDSNWQRQRKMIELNILALLQLTYLFGNKMRERNYGKILNVSSVAAFFAGPYMSTYYASKAFVLSFSQALAEELKEDGISVTALCPGPTTTGFEAAAHLLKSNMFKSIKPKSAKQVAKAGYKACMKNKTALYYGLTAKLMNIAARLFPSFITRKVAKRINQPKLN